MTRYGMVIDDSKCVGCYSCFLACRDEFAGNEYAPYSAPQPMTGMNWIKVTDKERGQYPKVKVTYTPVTCMHCSNPGCMKVALNGAIYKTKEGIVVIDPVKAKGQKQIVNGCPYRVIEWNEELQLPQKCDFCVHLLAKGETIPRCVEACPPRALVFGDLDDPKSEISKLIASSKTEILHPDYKMGENVSYIGLPKKFVAGTVIYDDADNIVKDLIVTLTGDGKPMQTKTNGFGDFEFDGLPDNTTYTVNVEAKGYKPKNIKVKTSKDTYLGEIRLKK